MTIVSFFAGVIALVFSMLQAPATAPQRFDYLVRDDFFAGLAGDEARMQKAQALCERALAENPSHAAALVWHGAILLARRQFQQGLKEMNDAAALAPDNPGVLIPRAAVLLEATRQMPEQMARPLLESAVANYEHVLEVQAPVWAALGDHGKGELLFGLAEGSARLGRPDTARVYVQRLLADAPTSGQTPRAKTWLETGSVPPVSGAACVGCHK